MLKAGGSAVNSDCCCRPQIQIGQSRRDQGALHWLGAGCNNGAAALILLAHQRNVHLLFDRVSAQQSANFEVSLGVAWIRNSKVYRPLAAGDWVMVPDDCAAGCRFGKLVACVRDDRKSGLGSSWRGWVMVPDVPAGSKFVLGSKFVFVNNDAIEQVSVVCSRISVSLTASNL